VSVLAEFTHHRPFERPRLPRFPTEFQGRGPLIQELEDHFSGGARLVTVVGLGGAGKTRIAVELARRRNQAGADPWVALVDLASATSDWDVLASAAKALGLSLGPEASPQAATERIAAVLDAWSAGLLVIDNAEQVREEVAAVVQTWLRDTDVRILVTSREPLRVYGEVLCPLSGMRVDDAVALFATSAALHGVSLDKEEAGVRALVRRLDGLPLALEMAAAQAAVLRPSEILADLDRGASWHPAGHRQRSLRGVLAWSWSQLDHKAASTLAQLSVFRGGFTLDACHLVVKGVDDPVAQLEVLCRRALVRAQEGGRFQMLALNRAFAAEVLASQDDHLEALRRHGDWARGLVESALSHPTAAARRLLETEEANLLAVVERATSVGVQNALAAAIGIARILQERGPPTRTLHLTQALVEAQPGMLTVRRHFVRAHALAVCTRHVERREELEAAVVLAGELGNPHLLAEALAQRSACRLHEGDADGAETDALRALELAPDVVAVRCMALRDLAQVARLRGQQDRAVQHIRAGLAAASSAADDGNEIINRCLLARILGEVGQAERAVAVLDEGMVTLGRVDSAFLRLRFAFNRGLVEWGRARLDEALGSFELAVDLALATGSDSVRAAAHANLTNLLLELDRPSDADQAAAEALDLYEQEDPWRGFALANSGVSSLMQGRNAVALAAFEASLRLVGPEMQRPYTLYNAFAAVAAHRAGADGQVPAFLEAAAHHGGGLPRSIAEAIVQGRPVADLMEAAKKPDALGVVPYDQESDLRLLLALSARAPVTEGERVLRVGDEGRWFQPPGGARVSLGRRRAPRKILDGLALLAEQGGPTQTVHDLFELGWPGERATFESARQRVYVAVHTLRKMGLQGILTNDDDGYLLNGTVRRIG
jgi:predicted ATPase